LKIFDQRGGDVDLLITDMRMPFLDGGGLVRELRARRQSLKILCISGYAVSSDFELPVLNKPFTRRELLDTVNDVLARADARPSTLA